RTSNSIGLPMFLIPRSSCQNSSYRTIRQRSETARIWLHWRHIDHGHSMRLAQLLKGRNIVGILSGHIHHDRVSNWYGIPVVVGTGQHAATDILRNDVLRMVRGSSFTIGTIRKSGLTVAFVPQPA